MQPFVQLIGLVAPLDRANVDTDAIMPKQFLKSVQRSGYGNFVFDEWRYLDKGCFGMDCATRPINPEFSLNQARYLGASILLTRENFGCGSSREHAVWGLLEFGIKCIIAPSFADIFYNNCIKSGILPITLASDKINYLFQEVSAQHGYKLNINLPEQKIIFSDKTIWDFEVDAAIKTRLIYGLDDIATTLQYKNAILAYEAKRREIEPWVF